MKKRMIILVLICFVFLIGCGQSNDKNSGSIQQENSENNAQEKNTEENRKEMSPEELFDLFCAGEIEGELRDFTVIVGDEPHSISAKDFDFEGADPSTAVTVGNPIDVDNDGELEFVLSTELHGDMYFDCKDGKVVLFAQGEYNNYCTNTEYDGATWIVYYDYTRKGKNSYYMYRLNGDLKQDGATYLFFEESGIPYEYSFNGEEITEEEYDEYYNKIFKGKN